MAIAFTSNIETDTAEITQKKNIFSVNKKISARDKKFFTEQLSLLLETGNSLIDSLDIVATQSDCSTLKKTINDIIEQLNGGKSFSAALTHHPEIFSNTYTSLIEAGENGGYMDSVLKHILEMEEKREDLISTLSSAFTYPAFLVFFAVTVTLFILAFVFPKFTDMFINIKDQLPTSTVILMWMSDILRNYWWALLAGTTGLISLFIWGLSTPTGKQKINDAITSIPIIGALIFEVYLIQTMRIIGLSLSNGVTLIDAINSCNDMVKNSRYLQFITKLNNNLNEGKSFSIGFNETDFIPPLIRQMIKTGEESGKLALICTRIADYYQQELSRKLKSLSKIIEPVMLLIMGVVVGVIVSSLILPIFKLSRAIH